MHGKISEVLATGLGNLPVVQVRTEKPGWFCSKPIETPNLLLVDGSNPDPHPSTCRICQAWLDPAGPIPRSAFWIVLFMVAFRYPTVTHNILTMACHCSLWMYQPPF